MMAELTSHTFPDRPDWGIVDESVPLGTKYEVLGYSSQMKIINLLTFEMRVIECYLLNGHDSYGWMPTACFKIIHEEPFNPPVVRGN